MLHSSPLKRPVVQLPPSMVGPRGPYHVKEPGREILADRTATSSTWHNADGSVTLRVYLSPHFRKTRAGWVPISAELTPVAGQPGWWRSSAGGLQASFGPAGSIGGAERLAVGGASLGISPLGVSRRQLAPHVSGATATYRGIWPGADLTETVLRAGVKEDIVLSGPDAPADYAFRVRGATERPNARGGLDVLAGGREVAMIPSPSVTHRSLAPLLSMNWREVAGSAPVAGPGARLSVSGDVVRVSVSRTWLAGLPASAFPVVIDPGFFPPYSYGLAAQVISVSSANVLSGSMQSGLDSSGTLWRSAAYISLPPLPAQQPGWGPWVLVSAQFVANCAENPPVSYCDSTAPAAGLAVYGETAAGTPTFSGIPGGQQLTSRFADASIGADATSYFQGRTAGWIGVAANEAGPGYGALTKFDPSNVFVDFSYIERPLATTITSPANGAVIATTTPTLTAAPVTDTPPPCTYCQTGQIGYDFVVSTSPGGAGTVIDSGWWWNTPSWTVPAGSLKDGTTYYGTVYDAEAISPWYDPREPKTTPGYVPPAASGTVMFTVKQRLGAGGPSPTDTVGSAPGQTGTPSKGTPSSGLSTASETVDMVTGNLAIAVGTHSVQALSGPAGLTLSYNSLSSSLSHGGNYGLTGQYYADSGSHTFSGSPAGQRVDPVINANWLPPGGPIGGILGSFDVRWTGEVALPAGTWELGGLTSGGMRVYVNGAATPAYDDWAGTAGSGGPSFGTQTVAGGTQYQIEVDDWGGSSAHVQLWAQNTAMTAPNTFLVPSNWLTPSATGLPPGWSMSADGAAGQWTQADDEGDQVVLHSVSGDTATFTRTASGEYQPPAGDQDFLSVNGLGRLQLSTAAGYVYTFNPDGSLGSMTTAADDRHPASLQYTYGGTPLVLRAITDPVSGRAVSLYYGGDSQCSTMPGFTPAPGMLCEVSYWDGSQTQFLYNGNGQLAGVNDVDGWSLFGYDSDNRLTEIRDPLNSEWIIAQAGDDQGPAVPGSCAPSIWTLQGCVLDTQVTYDSQGRVATVTQPSPDSYGPRPERTYAYASGATTVSIAGFNPASGYAKKSAYDSQGRITRQYTPSGLATSYAWDNAGHPIATADPAGEQTTTIYDLHGDVTDTYGPAPVSCFSGGWPAGVTAPGAPFIGYLPVASPQNTTGCQTAVPHEHTGYDEGITGLAATYWSNGQFAGAAALHGTGAGGSEPSTFCGATGGVLCAEWPAGSPPVTVDASGAWALRLTGFIAISQAQAYTFKVADSQPVSLSIDGAVIAQDNPATDAGYTPGQVNTAQGAVTLTAGTHLIDVDFTGSVSQLNEFGVFYGPSGAASLPVIPNSVLDPDYGLATSTTDADGKVTQTQYGNGTVGPELGLPTATVTDPAGLALTTTTAYEAPGSGYLRKTATTLPSGATTTYVYYDGTSGPVTAACGIPAGTPQGGELETETDPAPAGGQPRATQFIYTAGGQQAGVRVGPANTITSQPWQCTYYDAHDRISSQTWPAFNGAPARTVTYFDEWWQTYTYGMTSAVSDTYVPGTQVLPSELTMDTVDYLGRVTSYTDAAGKTTTTAYNQAGQETSSTSPAGTVTMSYDANSGQLTAVALNGTTLATAGYDLATGRLTSVTYANGTTAAVGYDALGRENSLKFTSASGVLVAGDQVTMSPASRDVSELLDANGTSLTNPNPAGGTATDYTYDGAGRLTGAYLPSGADAAYSYAANPAGDGCQAPAAGADTNRTQVTITPPAGSAQVTDYCYNGADQLTGTLSGGTPAGGSYTYDGHGNQTSDGGTQLTWDASDRLASTTTATGTTTGYAYDALDRVTRRTSAGTATGYWYAGYTDAPAGTLDANGNVTADFLALPGGVTVTVQATGNTWSYPDLHGSYTVTTDNSGTRHASPALYDPWGQPLAGSTAPANAPGSSDLGAYGASGKVTDTSSGIIVMGARAFNPAEARFLSVDPVQGGCANAYVYAFGDPLNNGDLTGQKAPCTSVGGKNGGGNALPPPGDPCTEYTFAYKQCTLTLSPGVTAEIATILDAVSDASVAVMAVYITEACAAAGPELATACALVEGIILAGGYDYIKAAFDTAAKHNGEVQISYADVAGVPVPEDFTPRYNVPCKK
jgi:RHS repeat-associated protein